MAKQDILTSVAAMDRLTGAHSWATDENRLSHKSNTRQLQHSSASNYHQVGDMGLQTSDRVLTRLVTWVYSPVTGVPRLMTLVYRLATWVDRQANRSPGS